MKIALICHVYPPEHAPAGVMISELAEDLTAHGHQVTVLTGWPNHPEGVLYPGWKARRRSAERSPQGFRIIRCGHSIHPRETMFWRLWYYLTFAVSTLVNGWTEGRFDAVLCLSTPIFGSWTAWILSRMKRARFIYDIFDLHPESAANAGLIKRGTMYRLFRWADTQLCRRSEGIVTLSEGMRSAIGARGISPDRLRVIPFWLDGGKIQPGPRLNAWRKEQGIDPELCVALYAGTIGFISGAEVLIDTAALLAKRKDILLLCVGEGPVKNLLAETAVRRGLENLRFFPFQPARVLDQVQAAADVGLVTLLPGANKTSMPSKVLGYLAAGRPIIASVDADSDTAKMIRDADCGRVTPSQDAEALARAIEELADHSDLRLHLGQRARLHFERFYDRKKCVNLYERVLTGSFPEERS